MRVIVESNAEDVAPTSATLVLERVAQNPGLVRGTATGRTMRGVYSWCAELHRERAVSFRRVVVFNLDGYVGVGQDHERSFHAFVRDRLVETMDMPSAALNAPDGLAPDPAEEASRYEGAIEAAGDIDLQLLGIGRNGYLGFNEPGASLTGRGPWRR